MRVILRKLDKRETLTDREYKELSEYIDALFSNSLESYDLFYSRYSSILWQDYSMYIPHFQYDIDDLINHMIYHPELFNVIDRTADILELFPVELHPYILYTFKQEHHYHLIKQLSLALTASVSNPQQLPASRVGKVIIKYEDANPYKEIGLKSHFERLAKYQFITRLQSYRYLTGSKARQDKIEVLEADKLGVYIPIKINQFIIIYF